MNITLSGPKEANAWHSVVQGLLDSRKGGEQISYQAHVGSIEIEILGITIPMGPMLTEVKGDLQNECAQKLEAQLNALDENEPPEELLLTLVNGSRIDEYSDWLLDTPRLEAWREKSDDGDPTRNKKLSQ